MKNYVGLFFTGVGIGIFLGLSKSPILLQILVPILTVIAVFRPPKNPDWITDKKL